MPLARSILTGLVLVVAVEASVKNTEHTHQPAYAPPNKPRGHQQPAPPGLVPGRPVTQKGPKETIVAPAAHFPSQLGLHSEIEPRKIVDTQVRCLKTHMQVTFRFSAPFSGYIYPYQHFSECLLFHGRKTQEASLDLKHGTCGDEENTVVIRDRSYLDPIIEHRLMVQWETDIVCEDDVSVIVRCDRPDDFNKTVEWRFETLHLKSSLEKSKHPGPKMWMEIQKGEGPTAPSLVDELVYIGDMLTLVFTLTDNVYWFDSNILACFALDGGEKKAQIEWDTSNSKQVSQAERVYSGEMTVIEEGCSTKPKIFAHFIKEKLTRANGDLVTLHYVYFKAFRFPTSTKIVLQCHVQVCYKTCPEPPPCSDAIHPRRREEARRRRRRQVEEAALGGAHEVDQVNMYRSVEVVSAEEGGEKRVSVAAQPHTAAEPLDCCPERHTTTTTTILFIILGILVMVVLVLVVIIFMNRISVTGQK